MDSEGDAYEATLDKSLNSLDFWEDLGRKHLSWRREFDQVLESNVEESTFKWFTGGKINVSENCIDRHSDKHPEKVALLWEKNNKGEHEKITYGELLKMTCQVANVLKREEVKKGDRVAIYMPVCPLQVAAMLACARIGAIHCVVFWRFSCKVLRKRISDCSCKIVFTTDEAPYKNGFVFLKKEVDNALKEDCNCVEKVFVVKRTGADVKMCKGRDVWLEQAMGDVDEYCPPEPLDSEDELFILYTSGSTGNPKGIVHTQAGYLLYAAVTHRYVFDYNPEKDIFACVADIGWITGHSYVVYGPLCNGGTTVLCDFHPTYPDAGRYWEMVDRLEVTHFYTTPTTIRKLKDCKDMWVNQYYRTSLRILGCVGEPLDRNTWKWYNEVVGSHKCIVVDTYWQTETGGVMIALRPAPRDAPPPEPHFPTRPFFGIVPVLINDKEIQRGNEVTGDLYFEKPWPGQARTIWKDHDRFVKTYYSQHPGYFFTGDGARRDHEGKYRITGRVDDVISIDGHRFGTAEIESVLSMNNKVLESAIVQYADQLGKKDVLAFVTLEQEFKREDEKLEDKVDDEQIKEELKKTMVEEIGLIDVPEFLVVPGLPKTKSGKTIRYMLKQIAEGKAEQELESITSLDNEDENVIKLIYRIVEEYNNKKHHGHQ